MSKEALRQAMKYTFPGAIVPVDIHTTRLLTEALKQALEQPEPEPVAWTLLLVGEHNGIIGKAGETFESHPKYYKRVDVYTSPPKRKPLTDEEIILIVAECASSHQHTDIHFARAIERAHGIKGLV